MTYNCFCFHVNSVLGASVTSFKSNEAEESRKAFTVAVEAAKNVVRSFKNAWETAKAVWSTELGDESKIETTDEYLKRAGSAINNIAKSEVGCYIVHTYINIVYIH